MSVPRISLALIAMMLLAGAQACDRTVTTVEEDTSPQSCFGCHDDQNTILVTADQQWQNSFHASGRAISEGESASCAGCHISQGFVQRSKGQTVTADTTGSGTVIHCFTCHQPHTNSNQPTWDERFALRWTTTAKLMNGAEFDLGAGNLCVACHQARRNVDTYVGTVGTATVTIANTRWGPHHGVQGDIIIGSNGYEYDGYTYERTEHRAATNDGCVDCHFRFASNNIVGGHSFNMRGDAVEEGGEFAELLNVKACSPCHGEVDDFNVNGRQDELTTLASGLQTLLEDAGLLANGLSVAGTTSADSAGALWNYLLIEEDRSVGVHNFKYEKGLLESSIAFLQGSSAVTGMAMKR